MSKILRFLSCSSDWHDGVPRGGKSLPELKIVEEVELMDSLSNTGGRLINEFLHPGERIKLASASDSLIWLTSDELSFSFLNRL